MKVLIIRVQAVQSMDKAIYWLNPYLDLPQVELMSYRVAYASCEVLGCEAVERSTTSAPEV